MDTGRSVSLEKLPLWLWLPRLVVVALLWQTLYYKFTGDKESVWIFSTLHIEPWGRYATGILEIGIGLGFFWVRTLGIASIMSLLTMTGALLAHLFVLGIEVEMDNGLLFEYALIVWVSSALCFYFWKK